MYDPYKDDEEGERNYVSHSDISNVSDIKPQAYRVTQTRKPSSIAAESVQPTTTYSGDPLKSKFAGSTVVDSQYRAPTSPISNEPTSIPNARSAYSRLPKMNNRDPCEIDDIESFDERKLGNLSNPRVPAAATPASGSKINYSRPI